MRNQQCSQLCDITLHICVLGVYRNENKRNKLLAEFAVVARKAGKKLQFHLSRCDVTHYIQRVWLSLCVRVWNISGLTSCMLTEFYTIPRQKLSSRFDFD